ncbi:hypothetical protein TUM19329_04950 [Legionella antarctica]|uniref:Uncharacterized protein n=1 Tax=Legionella antarctica TaxID=2708020 RepID=A0A6F8T0D0_9GAMM|nr:hypothetical protein [Legionella antarctica]BCA94134.1 hypothetical protein TUM19329_04950 [Legionella antarctica]
MPISTPAPTESTPLIQSNEETNEDLTSMQLENASRIYEKLIDILGKFENNTNSSIACLVPVNTSTSIFPEFVSPQDRLSASASSALAASLANSLITAWQNYSNKNTDSQKYCSFKSFVDFLKSPNGAPVCSYTMLLCFKTLGDFAPRLPDNAAMLSLIGSIFAVSLINGVLTHLGTKSEVNPLTMITRRDVANGMISGVTAAGFIAQIDRLLKMNMDPPSYETFGPYMLILEATVGVIAGMARIIIPSIIKSQAEEGYDRDTAISMMNTVKQNWDTISMHTRFIGNILYIGGLAIEAKQLLSHDYAAAVISAVLVGPVVATMVDTITSNCCNKPEMSRLITSTASNSPVFSYSSGKASTLPITTEVETDTQQPFV